MQNRLPLSPALPPSPMIAAQGADSAISAGAASNCARLSTWPLSPQRASIPISNDSTKDCATPANPPSSQSSLSPENSSSSPTLSSAKIEPRSQKPLDPNHRCSGDGE